MQEDPQLTMPLRTQKDKFWEDREKRAYFKLEFSAKAGNIFLTLPAYHVATWRILAECVKCRMMQNPLKRSVLGTRSRVARKTS